MRLDREICLGGRLNNKDILGIKYNGYVIYPYEKDNEDPEAYNFIMIFSYHKDCIDPYKILPEDVEYTINTTTDGETVTDEIRSNYTEPLSFSIDHVDKITRLKGEFNSLDFSSTVESMNLSETKTSSITDMHSMFYPCSFLIELNLSGFDTSNVTDMTLMFDGCKNLISLDLSNFNTSNVTDMPFMFAECINLTELNLSNFNMTNVGEVEYMFYDCRSLHTLRLDNCNETTIYKIINSPEFPTEAIINSEGSTIPRKIYVKQENVANLTAPKGWVFEIIDEPTIYKPYEYKSNNYIIRVNTLVTSEHTDLSSMFYGCTSLTTINGIDQWDTSNVTDMSYMFCFCESLSTLDLSKWDTSNVTNISHMFKQCEPASGDGGLTELNLSGWNTSKVTNMNNAFYTNLHVLDIRDFDMTNVTNTDNMICMGNRLHTLRLDNCSYDSIKKIIESKDFPSGEHYQGLTRKIYVNPDNVGDLTPPLNWVFINCLTDEEIVQK